MYHYLKKKEKNSKLLRNSKLNKTKDNKLHQESAA